MDWIADSTCAGGNAGLSARMTLRCLLPVAVCLLLQPFLISCKKKDQITVTDQRELTMHDRPSGLVAVMPPEWRQVPGTRFRLLNYRFAEDSEVFLGRSKGDVLANINRWLGQFGGSPLDTLDGLEKVEILGKQGFFVTATGNFGGGMGRPPRENAALAGIIVQIGDGLITLKMVGDAEAVSAEHERLKQFSNDLRIGEADSAETEEPAAQPETISSKPETTATEGEGGTSIPENVKTSSEERGGFVADIPATWKSVPSTRFRILNYQFGEGGEITVGRFGGGVLANINRWLGQFGQPSLQTLDELKKVEILGKQGVMVTATGKFAGGMGKPPRENAGLAGIILQEDDGLLTVKMIGGAGDVAAERERLIQFAKSLRIKEADSPEN